VSYKIKLVISVIVISFIGCINSFVYEKKFNGGYYLEAVDSKEQMNLGFYESEVGIGIISQSVFGFGQNDNYIIVEQHPFKFPNPADKKITNYFIIPLRRKISKNPEKNIIGPIKSTDFINKCKELEIEKLKFSIIFEELK